MSEPAEIPEQDQEDLGDDLPTYDYLAEKHGPNSRFGRWRSWIEKRAAERYADVPPDELARRRARGWGNTPTPSRQSEQQEWAPQPNGFPAQSGSAASRLHLHVQTKFNKPLPSPPIFLSEEPSEDAPPLISQPLSPTHINLHQFGSRFLPHTNAPIRTLLPLLGDKLLLIGHDDGLSVLNMFPHEWTESGLRNKGPAEAQAHAIWRGESVLQLSFLEVEDIGEGTPQGVVLALVGSESENSKDPDGLRSLRMYNLASLISLAKWAISQKESRPLDLRRPANWSPQRSNHKKHKSHASLAKSLKLLMVEGQRAAEPSSSYQKILSSPGSSRASVFGQPTSSISQNASSDSEWDLVDDLSLRWATDYVPLATAGSRLVNTSVLSYDLWRDERQVRGGALLAVATKSSILLYESPKGERAFQFVKDFYTPLSSRSVTFVRQTISDSMSRSLSDATRLRQSPESQSHVYLSPTKDKEHARQRHHSMVIKSVVFGNQLSLFVVFEKKAGLIRLADSSVAEVELYDDSQVLSPVSAQGSLPTRKSRKSVSYDQFGFAREPKGQWTPPATAELPLASARFDISQSIHLLTRGKHTHILPSPLPPDLAAYPPLTTLTWQAPPSYVAPRVMHPASAEQRAYLQVVAFGEDGIETQELSLAFLGGGGGAANGKTRADEPVCAQAEYGVESGFLAHGGHWHCPPGSPLGRAVSTRSGTSTLTFDSSTEELVAELRREEGIYGWQRKGIEDWRVVWLGGAGHTQPPAMCEDNH